MSKSEKTAYLEAIRERYRKANRPLKRLILNEFCEVCHYHRKHAIRLLSRKTSKVHHRSGRKALYRSDEFLKSLKRFWLKSDQMCSKKLKAAIPIWLPHYAEVYESLSPEAEKQLLNISASTIDRLLKPVRLRHPKGLCGTKPGTLLRNQIPIKTHNWDVNKPGYMEADTVAHCGNSLEGDFVWSLTLTDILIGWTECRAVWNKGSEQVVAQIQDIETHLPFLLRGFDADNGSEFLNHHLVRYFASKEQQVAFTRGRPYHKNDNAHVEQKNWAVVRQLFGYDRFEEPALVGMMNDLYANEWSLYHNFFCPTLKIKSKHRINSKYKKQYENPRTPYQRALESADIAEEKKIRLQEKYAKLNPFVLKTLIERKLKAIFSLVSVTSNVRQRI